jgi:hypothetical protein
LHLLFYLYIATATSAIALQLLKLFHKAPEAKVEEEEEEDATTEFTSSFTRGIWSVALGGVILGFGMQLSGSCPGTVWIQTGANASGFVAVWVGGLMGALSFSFLFESIEKSGFLSKGRNILQKYPSLPDVGGGYTGFLLAVCLAGVVFFADILSPQNNVISSTKNVLFRESWHPAIAGIFVGILEIPAAVVVKQLIGSSQTYVHISGKLLNKVMPGKTTSYMKKHSTDHTQTVYMCGAILGSLLSWMLSHNFDLSLFVR